MYVFSKIILSRERWGVARFFVLHRSG